MIQAIHGQVEYLRNSTRRKPPFESLRIKCQGRRIDFNRKDRAKRYRKSSIFNRQYSIPVCPGWVWI